MTCLKSFKSLSFVGPYAALNEINSLISTVDELVGTGPTIYVLTINFSHTLENKMHLSMNWLLNLMSLFIVKNSLQCFWLWNTVKMQSSRIVLSPVNGTGGSSGVRGISSPAHHRHGRPEHRI